MQLGLLNKKKLRELRQKGFTLVELLIVVVVLGVLSAVALPNFLGANERAKRNSSLTSTIEMSKECASEIVLDEGRTGYSYTAYSTNDLVTVTTPCSATGGEFKNVVAQDAKGGELCVADAAATGEDFCTIKVNTNGERSGLWS